MIRVTVWNEYKHEQELDVVKKVYPDGIHGCIKAVPVGDGRIPIKEVVTRLTELGYDGYFAIEHFDAEDQFGFMGKSANFLKSI